MLDIIFLSYDEPNAERNWKLLSRRFPHAKRVHGVKGIANAHMAAAKKAATTFFYVVDGDAVIYDSFDFSYKPTEHEADYVHIWYARNPAIDIAYGYGGVKLFSKKFFKNITNQVDFSTTLTKDIKVMPTVVGETKFNSDPYRAFRGAYREATKLMLNHIKPNQSFEQMTDDKMRLKQWFNPREGCAFREYIVAGVKAAEAEAIRRMSVGDDKDAHYVNDHDFILEHFNKFVPSHTTSTEPPSMSNEFRFISRIASILYDPYVLRNLPIEELRDAFSDGQLNSKLWLVEEFAQLALEPRAPIKVAIVGGWIGTLSFLLNQRYGPLDITSIDINEVSNRIAEKLNYDTPNFKTLTMDMYDVDYSAYDVIINTSSEHIEHVPTWRNKIPAGKIVIVQNTDYLDAGDHVSTVENVEDLRELLNPTEVLYQGTLNLSHYKRFMLIGRT